MKLIQKTVEPICGYWDGGKKNRFEWSIDNSPFIRKNDKNIVIVGSWEANYRFQVKEGRTEKETLRNAKFHLKRISKFPCSFIYEK